MTSHALSVLAEIRTARNMIEKHTAAARRNMVTRTPFFLTPGPVVVGGHNCGKTVRSSAIPGSVHKKKKRKKRKRSPLLWAPRKSKMTVIMSVAPYPDIRVFVVDFPMGRDSLIKCPFCGQDPGRGNVR